MPTIDLSEFGYAELDEAKDILDALIKYGTPSDFYDEGLQIMMNPSSGYVFLTNNEYDAAMVGDDGKLHTYYSTPYDGVEGFADDLYIDFKHGNILEEEDLQYLVYVFENSDDAKSEWADEVKEYMEENGMEIL